MRIHACLLMKMAHTSPPSCRGGHCKVTWDLAAGTMVPYRELAEAEADLGDVFDCGDCDDGFRDLPHHDFKSDVTA
jgi:hypothetical protein